MTYPEPVITQADVIAVVACVNGTAGPDQQKHAMAWIANELCHVSGLAPDGSTDLELAHHEGRRFVGVRLKQMLLPSMLSMAQKSDAEQMRRPK